MKKAYIVGISGGSCSGKTTFQDLLEEELKGYKLKCFHMDEYFKEASKRPKIIGMVNGKQYIDDNHPQTLDLDQFHKDVNEAIQEDWDIILIEGVFSLWDSKVTPLLDLKIYVDCDEEERFRRRIVRHISYGQEQEEIADRYIHAVKQRHLEFVEPTKWRADILINGFTMPKTGLQMAASWIKSQAEELGGI